MRADALEVSLVNAYVAHKQHLLPTSRASDVVQAIRDIVALHATDPTSPYLSLWARVAGFEREALETALYEQRMLVKLLCMRVTLHVVPSDEFPSFFQAFSLHRTRSETERFGAFLVQAGLCRDREVESFLVGLQRQVLDVLAENGPSTVRQINQAVPQLKTKIKHSEGKAYAGEFSVGSYLIPNIMAARGLLVRTRTRGTWRSNLHEYAPLSDWVPDLEIESVTPEEARAWLVRRYLEGFGPASFDDVQWWTGFTKGETREALNSLGDEVMEVAVEELGDAYLMVREDHQQLRSFVAPDAPYVLLLPCLDPYIMGYRGRDRFLAPEHRTKLFDRAGNAVPTVWVNGRLAGAWAQRKGDGHIAYELFESASDAARALEKERQRLEAFLDGEYLAPRFRTPFTRALEEEAE
jgi:hypothetical protein